MTELPIGLPQTEEEGCPYLEICENEALCYATDWGRTQDPETKEVKQHYGVVPSGLALLCSTAKHVTCTSFKKKKNWERELVS